MKRTFTAALAARRGVCFCPRGASNTVRNALSVPWSAGLLNAEALRMPQRNALDPWTVKFVVTLAASSAASVALFPAIFARRYSPSRAASSNGRFRSESASRGCRSVLMTVPAFVLGAIDRRALSAPFTPPAARVA